MIRKLATRRRDEEGSALILALFFAVIFSIFVTAVITFADVGLKSSKAFRSKRVASTGPDAAVEAAIQRRLDGAACDDENFSPQFDGGPVGGRELAVRCQNLGVSAEGSIGGVNKPRSALLALGTDASEGIINASPNLRVRGDVFSASKIESSPDPMVVEGRVSALGACNGVSTDTNPSTVPSCGGDGDPKDWRDPDFTKSITAVPIRRTIDASFLCEAPGWLVKLDPGYYDDADQLSALTSGGTCAGKVVWMQPGTYYLDLGFRGGKTTWSITDPAVNVVGGEPEGWDPLSADPPEDMPVPGSCRTTGDGNWGDGVEIIAGGQSRIDVVNGRMELCAPPRPSEQQIALYGNPTAAFTHILEPNAVLAADGFDQFTTRAFVIGEKDPDKTTTNATIAAGDEDGVSLTLGQFRQTIPTGALVHSAVLRIRHQESGDTGAGTPSLSIPNCGPPKTLPVRASLGDYFVNLMVECGFDTPLELSELTATYKLGATVPGTAEARIDGVAVEVSYRVPETRKPGAAAAGSGFTPPEAAFEIGERPGAVATATLSGPGPTTASITLTGFADPSLPANTMIDSAVLRIPHAETPGVTVSVAPAFNSNTCTTPDSQALSPDQVEFNLKACGLDEPADLAGLSVTYTATRVAADSVDAEASLDGIWLELVYPQFGGVAGTATSPLGQFATPSEGRVIDGNLATANVSAVQTQATLSLSAWDSALLPAGAQIDMVRLRIRHQETGTIQSVNVEAAVSGLACKDENLSIRPTLSDDLLDLKDCGIENADDLAGFTVSHTVTSSIAGGSASVDGVELQIAYTGATPPATTTRRNASTVAGTVGFSNPENAFAEDGTTANALLAPLVSEEASLTLSGYGTPLPPRGSVIESARLRVVHSTPAPLVGSVSATFDGGACPAENAGDGSDLYVRDLAECGGLTAEALSSLSVKYEVRMSEGQILPATAAVDAMVLDIEFRAPSLRPLEGCAVTTTTDSCPLVRSAAGTDPSARFVVNGTTYAPTAKFDFTMVDLTRAPFTRGVVARTINLNLSAASSNQRPLIGVPPESVLFTAYPRVSGDPDTTFPITVASGTSQAVGGFDLNPSLDGGTVFDSAMLRVRHTESGATTGVTITVNATCKDLAITPSGVGIVETYSLDLTYCGIQTPADLEALTVTYSVSGTGTSTVQGISVDVYTTALLRARVNYDLEGVTVEGWSVLT